MSAVKESREDLSIKNGNSGLTLRFRLLGIAPLMFFTAHLLFYLSDPVYSSTRGVENMLWMCNVANLLLGAGLLFDVPRMIRLAVIWLIPGLPIWLFDAFLRGSLLFTSFLTHIGGLVVGVIVMRRVRADKWSWLYAFAWYLLIQQLSRLFTSEYWNVNVAHKMYPGYESVVSHYWQFWLLTTMMVAVGLCLNGLILMKLFPPSAVSSGARR